MLAQIEDREHETVPKADAQLVTPFAPNEHAGGELLPVVEAETAKMLAQWRAVTRREAKGKALRILPGNAAPLDVGARRGAARLLPQVSPKKLARCRVHLPQRLTRIRTFLLARHLAHFHADPRAHPLHGLDKVEPQVLLQKGEDISLLTAHEAIKRAARQYGEIVVLTVMKWTWPAKARTDALQLHELADDLDDVRFVTNAIDDFVGYHQSSATVTPAPPSFQAPRRNCFTRVSFFNISLTRSRSAPVPFP